MSFEVTGKLIDKGETQRVKDTFQKREFVIELTEEINGNSYTNYAKMQLVQQKCDIIDRFNTGSMIKINFNIKGNRWEKEGKVNYITNLDAWRIEAADSPMNNGGSNNGQQQATGNNNNGGNNGGNWSNNNNNNNGNTNWNGGNSGGNNNNNNAAAYSTSAATENADDLPF